MEGKVLMYIDILYKRDNDGHQTQEGDCISCSGLRAKHGLFVKPRIECTTWSRSL